MFFKGWRTALAPHAEGTETQDGLVYCRDRWEEMLVGYYLPGNSPAPPPSHRAGGTTANKEVEQSQFDPFPPERWPGGASNVFCQLRAV